MKKPYNGHESWTAWNVSLWINNDESLYEWSQRLIQKEGKEKAAKIMARELVGSRTPDGAKYSYHTIRLAICE